jgi:tRNA dimethylallyltransferase
MQAIGYRHLMAVVDGQDTLDGALAGMRRDTRHFARRQRTWFRAVRDAVWIKPDPTREIESRVRAFLEAGENAARYCSLDM